MEKSKQHPLYDPTIMAKVIKLSKENINNGGPFAAAVVKGSEIIAYGQNSVTCLHDPTAHAEVVALRNACKILETHQLTDCIIYTSCEPCPMCLGAIYWARPKLVFYANTKEQASAIGFDDHFIYEQIEAEPQERSIPMFHISEQDAKAVFDLWHNLESKKMY